MNFPSKGGDMPLWTSRQTKWQAGSMSRKARHTARCLHTHSGAKLYTCSHSSGPRTEGPMFGDGSQSASLDGCFDVMIPVEAQFRARSPSPSHQFPIATDCGLYLG
eukprot:1868901-Rhodomonas_salina.1